MAHLKEEQKIAHLSGLWSVKANKVLHWPRDFSDDGRPSTRHRGGPGYVVDLSKRWEKTLCLGFERALEPAPKGSVAEKIVNMAVLNWMAEQKWISRKSVIDVRTRRSKLKGNSEKAKKPEKSDLPGLDETPRTPRTARKKKEEPDAGTSPPADPKP